MKFSVFAQTKSTNKLGPRRNNHQAAGTAAQQHVDNDQAGPSQQPRFQFSGTPINGSNIVAVSSAPQQGIVTGRQQGQKPIQVNTAEKLIAYSSLGDNSVNQRKRAGANDEPAYSTKSTNHFYTKPGTKTRKCSSCPGCEAANC